MKIIFKDFIYKGKSVEELTFNFSQFNSIEDVPEDKMVDYIKEQMDLLYREKLL